MVVQELVVFVLITFQLLFIFKLITAQPTGYILLTSIFNRGHANTGTSLLTEAKTLFTVKLAKFVDNVTKPSPV